VKKMVVHWHDRLVRSGLAVLISSVALTTPSAAQPPEVIALRGEPSCTSCRIVVEPVAIVGDRDGPGIVTEAAHIWQDHRGRFIVSAAQNEGTIQVFDSMGRFLAAFGRSGKGPGEFTRPRILAQTADTLLIFDNPQLRLTRVSGEFEVISMTMLPLFPSSIVRLANGAIVAATIESSPGAFGMPLHLLSSAGDRILRSFGSDSQTVRIGEALALRRTLAASRDETFWAAHQQRYRIERWDADRGMLSAIEREVPWFEPYMRSNGVAREAMPSPAIRAIQEDDAGLLWVLVSVADRNWQPLPPAREERGMTYTGSAQRNRLHDTIIEVIDPEARTVIASIRVDEHLAGFFPGPAIVFSYREDEDGHPSYRVSRLRLTSNPKGEVPQ
jgi:hypothetical protein